MADTYAKVDGKWHLCVDDARTACGEALAFGGQWTNHDHPTKDLCQKCFKPVAAEKPKAP